MLDAFSNGLSIGLMHKNKTEETTKHGKAKNPKPLVLMEAKDKRAPTTPKMKPVNNPALTPGVKALPSPKIQAINE